MATGDKEKIISKIKKLLAFDGDNATQGEVAKALYEETRTVIATMAYGIYRAAYHGRGRSYCEGFAHALWKRAVDQAEQSVNSGRVTALVRTTKQANQTWLKQTHGITLTPSRTSHSGTNFTDAFSEGQKDGRNHEFRPGSPTKKLSGGRLCLPSGGI